MLSVLGWGVTTGVFSFLCRILLSINKTSVAVSADMESRIKWTNFYKCFVALGIAVTQVWFISHLFNRKTLVGGV